MQFKHLFLCFCLGAATIVSAHDTFKASHPILPKTTEGVCSILPPANFHEEEIGTDFVRLAWDVGSAANSIRIRAFRASDHFLISTVDVPAGTSKVTISGLPPETGLNFEAQYLSNQDCNTDNVVTKNACSVILDLIVIGYQPGIPNVLCTIYAPSGQCTLPNTGQTTEFRISNSASLNLSRTFGMQKSVTGWHAFLLQPNSKDPSGLKFRCTAPGGSDVEPYCYGPSVLEIWQQPVSGPETRIAKFKVFDETDSNISLLVFFDMAPGFKVEKFSPSAFDDPTPGEERGTSALIISQPATVSPNPFSNNLDVYLPENATEQVHLQLYNLAGQKVLDQQFAGGQEQYSLSTANLSPGFYMLRIEAGGEVQTLKVVKSE